MGLVMRMCDQVKLPKSFRRVCNFGFEVGLQVQDVVGSLRIMLARSAEWSNEAPVFLAQGDILSAFDFLSHDLAAEAMEAAKWNPQLVAMIHSANTGITAKTELMGTEVDDFQISKCYKQGSVEGPKVWKIVVTYLLSMLVPCWLEMGWGLNLNNGIDKNGDVERSDFWVTHLIWADNIWLLASSSGMLKKMHQSLTDLLTSRKLYWKPSDLKVMTTAPGGVAAYKLSTMDPVYGRPEKLPVVPCEELIMLGTNLTNTGSNIGAIAHRIAQGEKAMMANYNLLMKKNAPVVKRMAEYCKRVVPVVLHGAGCWSWNAGVFWRLHRFEGRCLGKILGWVKVSDDEDAQNNWWQVRVGRARQIFLRAGFEPLTVKCLKKIYQFSFRLMNADANNAALTLVVRCLSWRCQRWWKHREGMEGMTRALPGRPLSRWEDIFTSYNGVDWMRKMNESKEGWKKTAQSFVVFAWRFVEAKVKLQYGDDKPVVRKFQNAPKEKVDVDQDISLFSWSKPHKCTRLELLGDSNLIVNWTNATWPVTNWKQQQIIGYAQTCLWRWCAESQVLPRHDHCDWCRHVPRELNQTCDDLAAEGHKLGSNDLYMFISNLRVKDRCIVGRWDGGFKEGDDKVSIGFVVDAVTITEDGDSHSEERLIHGFGRCVGDSAVKAELRAYETLVHTLDFMFKREIDECTAWCTPPAFTESCF